MFDKLPTSFFMVTGASEGYTPLNAFDGALLEHLGGHFHVYVVAAGEHVDGRVAEFGPGVNCQMGFCNDHDAGNTMGIEFVKYIGDNCRTGDDGGISHSSAYQIFIVQCPNITAVKFYQ